MTRQIEDGDSFCHQRQNIRKKNSGQKGQTIRIINDRRFLSSSCVSKPPQNIFFYFFFFFKYLFKIIDERNLWRKRNGQIFLKCCFILKQTSNEELSFTSPGLIFFFFSVAASFIFFAVMYYYDRKFPVELTGKMAFSNRPENFIFFF